MNNTNYNYNSLHINKTGKQILLNIENKLKRLDNKYNYTINKGKKYSIDLPLFLTDNSLNIQNENNTMDDKLKKCLEYKTLEELASLRGLVSSMRADYDRDLTTYATLNDDKAFMNMPPHVKDMHDRRGKLTSLLMCINSIIEDKLFKLYE
jgi:hypothetical protein